VLGFRVQGSEFRVQGVRVQGVRVQGSEFRCQGSTVHGFGFQVSGEVK